MNDTMLGLLGVLGVLLGLAGVVVPVVPGLLVVLVVTVATLAVQGTVPWAVVGILVVLAGAGSAASIVLPARRLVGAEVPRRSLVLAGAGAVVGFFVVPVLGLLLGAVAGLLLAEQQRTGEWATAWASSRQVLAAYGIGVVLELLAGVVMGAVWLVAFVVRA